MLFKPIYIEAREYINGDNMSSQDIDSFARYMVKRHGEKSRSYCR